MKLPERLHNIQILTGTYEISPEGNITLLAPPKRFISYVPVDICYITCTCRWSNEWFNQILWCSMTTTKFGNKSRSLRTKQTERKLDSFARFLLWRSIVNYRVLPITRGISFLVNFLIWNWCYCCCRCCFLLNLLYFPGQYNSVFDRLSMRA